MTDRQRIIAEALSRIGDGPKPEWHGQQWCGRWILDVYQSAGFGQDLAWPTGFALCKLCDVYAFLRTDKPMPGDFGVQDHAPWHHIILVDDGSVVAGNTGPSPGIVNVSARPESGYTWYSIEPVEAVP